MAKRAVTFNKNDPGALMALGSVYASEQHFDDARAQFEAAFALAPKDPAPIFQIATTYAQQDNIPMALQTVGRALAIDPRNIQALVFKADLYARQHDDAHTSEAYDDAVVAAPTDDEKVAILIRKATYFISEKKDSQGVAIFQQITQQFPKVPAGFSAFGDYYASVRQYPQAIAQWQAALAIDPNTTGALLGMGEISLLGGKVNDSVSYLKKYTQISPDAQGFALLGQAYSRLHDYNSARECLREELRNPAIALDAGLRCRRRLRTEELQGSGADLRRDGQSLEELSRWGPSDALHRRQIVRGGESVLEGYGGVQTAARPTGAQEGREGIPAGASGGRRSVQTG